MPVSKKRKRKDGSVAKFKRDRYERRRRQIELDIENGEHMSTGVTLQDLINMAAYQEYLEKGLVEGPEIPDTSPVSEQNLLDTEEGEAVIRALNNAKKHSQHGNVCDLKDCYGQLAECQYKTTNEEERQDGGQ